MRLVCAQRDVDEAAQTMRPLSSQASPSKPTRRPGNTTRSRSEGGSARPRTSMSHRTEQTIRRETAHSTLRDRSELPLRSTLSCDYRSFWLLTLSYISRRSSLLSWSQDNDRFMLWLRKARAASGAHSRNDRPFACPVRLLNRKTSAPVLVRVRPPNDSSPERLSR